MNKKDFILKYMEKSGNILEFKEAQEDINILFTTLKNVLIAQGKVSFFGKGTFELVEKKEKIIEVVYRNILFKCIYLWWRLYDRIFDAEEVCE